MKIKAFTVNPFAENTYLVFDEEGRGILFDPGFMSLEECNLFDAFVTQHGIKISRCLQTHCHIDHVLGVHHINNVYGIKSEMHSLEQHVMQSGVQVARMYGLSYTEGKYVDTYINENDCIEEGSLSCRVLFTPGHSPGSVCYYFEKEGVLVAGDLIFQGSVGRTDLPGGNHSTLLESVKSRIFVLPDNTRIYPGHGSETTVADEKKFNPFLQGL